MRSSLLFPLQAISKFIRHDLSVFGGLQGSPVRVLSVFTQEIRLSQKSDLRSGNPSNDMIIKQIA